MSALCDGRSLEVCPLPAGSDRYNGICGMISRRRLSQAANISGSFEKRPQCTVAPSSIKFPGSLLFEFWPQCFTWKKEKDVAWWKCVVVMDAVDGMHRIKQHRIESAK